MTTPDITTRLRESEVENPPAFPRDERYLGHNGMTLRDWFAGQVMASAYGLPYGEADYAQRAKIAYAQADAMLARRSPSQIEEGKDNG